MSIVSDKMSLFAPFKSTIKVYYEIKNFLQGIPPRPSGYVKVYADLLRKTTRLLTNLKKMSIFARKWQYIAHFRGNLLTTHT